MQKPWRQALPDVPDSKIGWYRLVFDIPDHEDTGSRMFLVFDSVDAEVSLWINGQLVYERGYPHQGNYDSWSESFWVEATDTLQDGAPNDLVLRVESESHNGGITGGGLAAHTALGRFPTKKKASRRDASFLTV